MLQSSPDELNSKNKQMTNDTRGCEMDKNDNLLVLSTESDFCWSCIGKQL